MTKLGSIGDVNPIEHSGGYVFQRGERDPEVEYFDGVDDDFDDEHEHTTTVTVYCVDLHSSPKLFLDWLDWVNWDDVRNSCGLESIEDMGLVAWHRSLDAPQERANAIHAAAGYYGWHEFDQCPMTMTVAELKERWE